MNMRVAARAILVYENKMLVMRRNKYGNQYYTLVGGASNEGEAIEQTLVREVKEETGLDITAGQLVFVEKHPEPHNEQYIFWCEASSYGDVMVQEYSEEGFMNRMDANVHTPMWVSVHSFPALEFRTPQLQVAIAHALQKGFPNEPLHL
jgi:ADP-ribose pyrophosphatase YjhB (NUDIX family)